MSHIIGFVFLIFWIVKAINKTFSEVNSNNAETKAPVFNNFSNNKLNETRKRTVYLHQYYVNEQPIFGNHQDYYLNYLVNLQPMEITVSTLRLAYQNTIVYPHKCKSTAKAAARYLKDRSIYLNMN
jgi:hypothetical protein